MHHIPHYHWTRKTVIVNEPNDIMQREQNQKLISQRPSFGHLSREYSMEYECNSYMDQRRIKRRRYCWFCILAALIILALIILALFGVFVVLPLIFMNSISLQRDLIFQRWNCYSAFDFTNFRKYGIEGIRNFYIPIKSNSSQVIYLGVWHILHLAHTYEAVENSEFNYENALSQSTHPVILYFHDSNGNRITYIKMYHILRRFFHVIAFDYRGYGDSSEAVLTENAVVQDCVQIYKWLRNQTQAPIYIWGNSLGASLSTHTIAKLNKEGIVPKGLFLQSPFNNIKEALVYFPRTKPFSWLPWFDVTVINGLQANGFIFDTSKHIKSVNSPIMIVHAEDDYVVPIHLGEKLYITAQKGRNNMAQGNVTFHKLLAVYGFGHERIYEAAELSSYIKLHLEICDAFDKKQTT